VKANARARALVFVLALFAVLFAAAPARAHKPSDSYLTLEVDGDVVRGRWDIALRDLDYVLDVDADADGKITWAEVRERHAAIASYALSRLAIRAGDSACTITKDAKPQEIATHSDGAYTVLRFTAKCPEQVGALWVDYKLFFDVDPQHRGILRLDAGRLSRTHVVSSSRPLAFFAMGEPQRMRQLGVVVREGIIHIWKGYDHVLFLLALLLPSVLQRKENDRTWTPVARFRPAIVDVLRIVTAFTVAHSITLSLAALGVVTLPSRLVESAIAASVVLAAVNNLYPVLKKDRWMAAFILGLMHGFGFSSTLMDLDLPRQNLVLTLFGFNLGVEIGQVAIVCVFVPVAYWLRSFTAYRRIGVVGGSVVIGIFAIIWLIERALLVKIIS
jgi:hypothetical protein